MRYIDVLARTSACHRAFVTTTIVISNTMIFSGNATIFSGDAKIFSNDATIFSSDTTIFSPSSQLSDLFYYDIIVPIIISLVVVSSSANTSPYY